MPENKNINNVTVTSQQTHSAHISLRTQTYLRAAAPAADPGFSGPAFPPLVGIARVFRTGVSVVLLKVALLESSFLSGVEVGARAERFIACSLDCELTQFTLLFHRRPTETSH